MKKKGIFIGVMAALLMVQLGVLFFYGNKKAGFHEDEFYTYYATNKTAGLFVNDRQLKNEYVPTTSNPLTVS